LEKKPEPLKICIEAIKGLQNPVFDRGKVNPAKLREVQRERIGTSKGGKGENFGKKIQSPADCSRGESTKRKGQLVKMRRKKAVEEAHSQVGPLRRKGKNLQKGQKRSERETPSIPGGTRARLREKKSYGMTGGIQGGPERSLW